MVALNAHGSLYGVGAGMQECVPLVPIPIASGRSTGNCAPALQDAQCFNQARGLLPEPLHCKAMRREGKQVEALLAVHAEIVGCGHSHAASLDKSATRFIAVRNRLSRPRRFARSSGSSAFTITASKKASTGVFSAASTCSEVV